ncbi:MAG: carbon storage regulator [Thermoguttaceae bacterium]|jgi:carbon storage regulator
MLVLTRKAGEKIFIGDRISVTVVRIAPGVVRLGVEAPPEYNIVRQELVAPVAASPSKESPVGSGQ